MTMPWTKGSIRIALLAATALMSMASQAAELTAADYTAIQQLYARYNVAIVMDAGGRAAGYQRSARRMM